MFETIKIEKEIDNTKQRGTYLFASEDVSDLSNFYDVLPK
jgi:hypothetical protein